LDVKTITHQDLVGLIASQQGAFTVGLLTRTDSRAKKTGNPFGQIDKICRLAGFVGANYEKAVNREGERQGVVADFKAESRPWGTWLIPNKVAENKGKFYLRTQSTPGQRKVNTARVLAYLSETGQNLKFEDVKPFLPVAKESTKQESAGLNETVFVREFAFDSIQKIRVAGQTFRLVK